MIRLDQIDLNERTERESYYRGGVIAGMTRGRPMRDVTIRLRIETDADLARIRDAIADLQRDPTEVVRYEERERPRAIAADIRGRIALPCETVDDAPPIAHLDAHAAPHAP